MWVLKLEMLLWAAFHCHRQTSPLPTPKLLCELWNAGTEQPGPDCGAVQISVPCTAQGSANPSSSSSTSWESLEMLAKGQMGSTALSLSSFQYLCRKWGEGIMERAPGFYCSCSQHIYQPGNEAQGGHFQFNPCLPAALGFLMVICISVAICVAWIVNICLLK